MPQRVYPVIQLDSSAAVDEPDAISSAAQSSPCISPLEDENNLSYDMHADFPEGDKNDFDLIPSRDRAKRASPQTVDEKAQATLDFMHQFLEFPLRKFLETVFTYQKVAISNTFQRNLSLKVPILELWISGGNNIWRFRESHIHRVGGGKAASACVEEVSWLSNYACEGPNEDDAKFLRVTAKNVSVSIVNNFRIHDLTAQYGHATPHFQLILNSIVLQEERDLKRSQ